MGLVTHVDVLLAQISLSYITTRYESPFSFLDVEE